MKAYKGKGIKMRKIIVYLSLLKATKRCVGCLYPKKVEYSWNHGSTKETILQKNRNTSSKTNNDNLVLALLIHFIKDSSGY